MAEKNAEPALGRGHLLEDAGGHVGLELGVADPAGGDGRRPTVRGVDALAEPSPDPRGRRWFPSAAETPAAESIPPSHGVGSATTVRAPRRALWSAAPIRRSRRPRRARRRLEPAGRRPSGRHAGSRRENDDRRPAPAPAPLEAHPGEVLKVLVDPQSTRADGVGAAAAVDSPAAAEQHPATMLPQHAMPGRPEAPRAAPVSPSISAGRRSPSPSSTRTAPSAPGRGAPRTRPEPR